MHIQFRRLHAVILASLLLSHTPARSSENSGPDTRVLDYLISISGHRVVAGIHNREPNATPDLQTEKMHKLTGKYPALWSGDFLFSAEDIAHRPAMILEAERQWKNGAIVQLMLHVAPPNLPETCPWKDGVLSKLTDTEWSNLITDGSSLNLAWKARLDIYSIYLKYLQDSGVQVLFRPFHEMNQSLFWWGGRKGPDGTARLFRLTHDYLAKEKHLTNLIWVWDMQDMSRDFAEYNPGSDYWDIFAFDVYAQGFDREWYDYILPIVGNKPIGIGECDKLPTAQMLIEQKRWCFFMSWAELTFEKNAPEAIKALYDSPQVVTRDLLPRFR